MNYALLSLAFFAGVAVFFTPCGIALLPSYIGVLVGEKQHTALSFSKQIKQGVTIGILAGLGMVTVFLSFGIIISIFGNIFAQYAFWFGTITGFALIILGVMMLAGKRTTIQIPHSFANHNGLFGMYIFGLGYALGGIGCTLPAFLFVVATAFSGESTLSGIANFVAFSVGAMLMMLTISVAAVLSRGAVKKFLGKHMGTIQKLTSVIVILGGIYLIYFQIKAFYL